MQFFNKNKVNIKSHLEKKNLDLKIGLNAQKYGYMKFQNQIETINRIIKNIDTIKSIATNEINKCDSDLITNLNGYESNLFGLKQYLEILETCNCKELYLNSIMQLHDLEIEILKRYLDSIINEKIKDDDLSIINEKIILLVKRIKIDILLINVESNLEGYEWLEDIYRKCYKIKKMDSMELLNYEFNIESLKNEYETINYMLNKIDIEKKILKLSKNNKIIRKGNSK